MTARCLMVQGSSSSAGKSLLVTALCRIYARRGLRVAPFKAQNMSNNAAACQSGGEIGRAQALQATAAGIEPTIEMNPILIKPEADARSQVIVDGVVWKTLSASHYYDHKEILWERVTTSLDSLRDKFDLVIMEGAGSPAELNLLPGDIVNMAVARYTRSPVLLVGDIDRGGIFAQLLGTLWLLEPEDRSLVRGLVVNKFRGDLALFANGINILEERGGCPVLGVIPYLKDLFLPEEDAVAIDVVPNNPKKPIDGIDIAVIRLPHISNFDDFDPLRMETGVNLRYVHTQESFGRPDTVILPGTKSTITDLIWLRESGLADRITSFAKNGGSVVGICGGYQMMGEKIVDRFRMESPDEECEGMGLLPAITEWDTEKTTRQTTALIEDGPDWISELNGDILDGYEIHNGRTHSKNPFMKIVRRNRQSVSVPDGAVSENGQAWGCYLHGIFGNDTFRHAWMRSLGWQSGEPGRMNSHERMEEEITRLADEVATAMRMDLLDRIIWSE
ncbi:MAG: cobyric acid synthase [Anaerolineaceae bacterium]